MCQNWSFCETRDWFQIAAIVKIRCSIQGKFFPWDGWFIQQTWMGRNHKWNQFVSWQKTLTAKNLFVSHCELLTFFLPIMSFWLFVATQLRSCPWVSGSCRENERNAKTKWLLLLLATHWSYLIFVILMPGNLTQTSSQKLGRHASRSSSSKVWRVHKGYPGQCTTVILRFTKVILRCTRLSCGAQRLSRTDMGRC